MIKKGIKFVHVSSRNVFVERLIEQAKKLGVNDRFIVTGYVPNEDLAIIYKLASFYIFPSLSERFGLPGLEAMACKCPVICSNIDVFKEVYGEAAVYFDPKDSNDIAKKNRKIDHFFGRKKLSIVIHG